MSDELREHVSALMDGELAGDQARFLLRRMETDTELARCWARYQLAGAMLRRERPQMLLSDDLADAVMRRAAAEPRPGSGIGRRVLRWAGGGAVAAAVAVVALVSTRPPVPTEPPGTAAFAVAPAPTSSAVTPVPMPIDLRQPVAPLPMLTGSDFAQPASYDSAWTAVPRYGIEEIEFNRLAPYPLMSRYAELMRATRRQGSQQKSQSQSRPTVP